jgi:hypothetical protein
MKRPEWGFVAATAAVLWAMPALAQSRTADSVKYTVRNGDTLLGLTAQYLQGADAFARIVSANRLPDNNRIYPGNVLTVPVAIMRSTPLQAKIVSFKGSTSLVAGGKSVPAAVGLPIRPGDMLQTGVDGFVTILLSNGSRMTLPTQSRVRIVQMRQFLLTKSTDFDFAVEKGRTEISVTPATNANNLFRLRTPIAVSAVRGTKFRIGYESQNEPSLTEVIEGKVAVDGANPAAVTATVPAGFGAAAAASGDVGTEELLPAPAIADAARLWRNRFLDFDLVPVATARGYKLQLANDAEFQDMVAETRSATTKLRLAGIDNGRYYARAMAVAPSGLEGLSQTVRINRELAALLASVSGTGAQQRITWETDGRGDPVFRLQLFRDSMSATPVIDETGITATSMTINSLPSGRYVWRVGMRRLVGGKMQEIWTDPEMLQIGPKTSDSGQ